MTPDDENVGSLRELKPAAGILSGLDVRELWTRRDVARALASRTIRTRYKQTALGVGWVVIQPLLTTVLFTLVFGRLAGLDSDGVPYAAFVISGLVLWNYVSAATQAATVRLVDERELITKVYFPRVLAPVASVLAPLVDLAVGIVVAIVVILASGIGPRPAMLLAPGWLALAVCLALGMGMLLGALNAQYRDVGYLVGFGLQIWLFASPIVYSSSSVDGGLRVLLACNPVTGIVDGLRWSLLGATAPPVEDLLSLLTLVLVFIGGLGYFLRVERRLADVV